LPVCYLDSKRSSVEYNQNISYRKKMLSYKKHFLNSVNDLNKIQTFDCNKCLYNNICSGIWEEYVGVQKLKPTNRVIDFFNSFEINDFAYKLKINNENLKKIYDKDIRQVIINSSLISNNLELIKKISNFAFYDISLFIDNEKDILKNPDLFTS
jgi:hypothetical protein